MTNSYANIRNEKVLSILDKCMNPCLCMCSQYESYPSVFILFPWDLVVQHDSTLKKLMYK